MFIPYDFVKGCEECEHLANIVLGNPGDDLIQSVCGIALDSELSDILDGTGSTRQANE